MNGWIDRKKERGLVNKHLRADKLPTGRGTERQRERGFKWNGDKKKKNVGERDKEGCKSFSFRRAENSQKLFPTTFKETDECKLKVRGEEKTKKDKEEEEIYCKDSLFQRLWCMFACQGLRRACVRAHTHTHTEWQRAQTCHLVRSLTGW